LQCLLSVEKGSNTTDGRFLDLGAHILKQRCDHLVSVDVEVARELRGYRHQAAHCDSGDIVWAETLLRATLGAFPSERVEERLG
jgi:signal transduction protein with GAF and PtsI domain